jgi:UDP-N-acetyl-D-mannosaminuronic acid transferase (WecB/TagA/CpsF family)
LQVTGNSVASATVPAPRLKILGISFHIGTLEEALSLTAQGGLVVVPSAPVLVDLAGDPAQREALEASDLALTDSAFLVLLWLVFKAQRIPRLSGLRFLRQLLKQPDFRQPGATFWVMPTAEGSKADRNWLNSNGLSIEPEDCYAAPIYPRGPLEDRALLSLVESRRPKYVVINLGGGVQERLGYFLRNHLSYRPAIICTGAAIAFLSGQQANIPPWADRLFLGWLLRSLNDPKRFVPRYWKALKLVPLVLKAR